MKSEIDVFLRHGEELPDSFGKTWILLFTEGHQPIWQIQSIIEIQQKQSLCISGTNLHTHVPHLLGNSTQESTCPSRKHKLYLHFYKWKWQQVQRKRKHKTIPQNGMFVWWPQKTVLTDSLVLSAKSGIFQESLKCNEMNSEGLVAKALQSDLKQATGVHSSDQTVRNRDHEGGLRARHPLVEPVHTLESEDPLFGSQFSSQMSTFTLSIVSIF